ncbi:hypothetical protein OSB04_017595 [Centaurea solstitialis]|uniref:Uncharacterized protein n=1 Tax=Centaurea solstitialis TaxID=347529 RepID=A0AA38WII1_9ASTR|nr:hypothetical protein OSB04_017595 [Centaurea solstitialis]
MKTVKYLYARSDNMTGDFWTSKYRDWVLKNCVECDFFDVALNIMESRPELARSGSALGSLARKPDAIFDRVQPKLLTGIKNSILKNMNMKVGPAEEDSDALKLLTITWNEIRTMRKSEVDDILRGPRDSITRDGKTKTRVCLVVEKFSVF